MKDADCLLMTRRVWFDDYVIHVCFNCLADLFLQACLNHALIGCTGIFGLKNVGATYQRMIQTCLGLMTTSSTYASTVLPICFSRHVWIMRW